jgi:hypothetical protein
MSGMERARSDAPFPEPPCWIPVQVRDPVSTSQTKERRRTWKNSSGMGASVKWLGCCYGSERVHDVMVRVTPARRVSRVAADEMRLAIKL